MAEEIIRPITDGLVNWYFTQIRQFLTDWSDWEALESQRLTKGGEVRY